MGRGAGLVEFYLWLRVVREVRRGVCWRGAAEHAEEPVAALTWGRDEIGRGCLFIGEVEDEEVNKGYFHC